MVLLLWRYGDSSNLMKEVAVKEGIDTRDIQKGLDFEKASGAMQIASVCKNKILEFDQMMKCFVPHSKDETRRSQDFYKSSRGVQR